MYMGWYPDAVQVTSGSPHAASLYPPASATSHAAVPVLSSSLSQPLSPLTPSTTLETLLAWPAPQGVARQPSLPTSGNPGEAAPSQVT
ncbi:hypothetical protein BGW80DRAFT_1460420 [Lactifluus volemus]|nr:hypothetical protein BGW80DRAFT_1460420 [Lactifluus volemus]